MQCPVCTTERLVMADRQGIEIDYCPKCRGVWLDRGELDKLIEKSTPGVQRSEPSVQRTERRDDDDRREAPPRQYERDDRHAPRYGKHDDDDDYKYGKGRRRKSFLGDIFDFD